MDNNEVIVTLTTRNLELDEQVRNLTTDLESMTQSYDTLRGHVDNMQDALGYCGHPANMVAVIKDRCKGN